MANPIIYEYEYGPGTSLEGVGAVALIRNSSTSLAGGRQLQDQFSFWLAPSGSTVSFFEPCPTPGSIFLPPDLLFFAITLFVLTGTQNLVLYLCFQDVVIGIALFTYVGEMPSPTLAPVRLLSEVRAVG